MRPFIGVITPFITGRGLVVTSLVSYFGNESCIRQSRWTLPETGTTSPEHVFLKQEQHLLLRRKIIHVVASSRFQPSHSTDNLFPYISILGF